MTRSASAHPPRQALPNRYRLLFEHDGEQFVWTGNATDMLAAEAQARLSPFKNHPFTKPAAPLLIEGGRAPLK